MRGWEERKSSRVKGSRWNLVQLFDRSWPATPHLLNLDERGSLCSALVQSSVGLQKLKSVIAILDQLKPSPSCSLELRKRLEAIPLIEQQVYENAIDRERSSTPRFQALTVFLNPSLSINLFAEGRANGNTLSIHSEISSSSPPQ